MNGSPRGFCPSFRAAPAPGQMYLPEAHAGVLAGIRTGLSAPHPVMVLSGDAGTGKTTVAAHLAHQLAGDRRVARIGLSTAQLIDLHHQVPKALRIDPEPAFDDPLAGPAAVLAACLRRGPPVLLIVDEAQALADEAMDWLARLTGEPPAAGPCPVTVLLVGASGLEARLAQPALQGVRARLGGRFRLAPFDEAGTTAYIAHRFRISGCACHAGRDVFDAAGLARLHALSGGIPRVINHLVQSCLFEAQFSGRTSLDGGFVEACLSAMAAEGRLIHLPPPAPARTAAAGACPAPAVEPPVPAAPACARRHPPARTTRARASGRRAWLPAARLPLAGRRRAALAGIAVGLLILVPTGEHALRLGPAALADLLPSVPVPAAAQRPAPAEATAPPRVPDLSRRVAVDSVPDADRLLADALALGQSDPHRAAPIYEQAALWGNARAAYYLGQLYETGVGVAPDPQRARGWYGAAPGIDGAARRLAELDRLPARAPAEVPAPVPARHLLFSQGQTELHWTASGPVPRFRVQYMLAGEAVPRHRDTELTGMLIGQPVTRWRVLSLRPGGAEGPASAWSSLDPGGR